MKAKVTGISKKPSHRGGIFTWIFFKSLDADTFGKSFRTCSAPEFGNFSGWSRVVKGMILDNLYIKYGTLIDADSSFKIVGREETGNV